MLHTATATDDSELITVSFAARELGTSEGTVRRLANDGQLRCTRLVSGLRLFLRSDVERLRTMRGARL